MEFERGNIDRPSGNLIIYCHVIGENPLQQDARIIASNIFVSFLNHNNNLPAITFPPVPFDEFGDLERFLGVLPFYELHRIPDFQFPDDPAKAQEYINKRLQEVNDLVKEYVELCAAHITGAMENMPTPPDALSEDIEKLEYMQQLSDNLQSSDEDEGEQIFEILREYWQKFLERHPQYPLQEALRYVKRNDQLAKRIIDLYFRQSKAIYYEDYEEADKLRAEIQRLSA